MNYQEQQYHYKIHEFWVCDINSNRLICFKNTSMYEAHKSLKKNHKFNVSDLDHWLIIRWLLAN